MRKMKRYLILIVIAISICGCSSYENNAPQSYAEALLKEYKSYDAQIEEILDILEAKAKEIKVSQENLTAQISGLPQEDRLPYYKSVLLALDKKPEEAIEEKQKIKSKIPIMLTVAEFDFLDKLNEYNVLLDKSNIIMKAREDCKQRMHEYLIAKESRPVINNYSPPVNTFDPIQYQYDHLERQRQQNQMYNIQSSLNQIEKNTRKPLYPNNP